VNGNSTLSVGVEAGDRQVVAHVGLHALGRFADRLGFGARLSERIAWTGERAPGHDRGSVLVQAMLMLAGGGESCADIEHLRAQDRLFGPVASAPTLYRALREIDAETLDGLRVAMAQTRAQVWGRSGATTGTSPVVLDIDASLVEIHSEHKVGTAPHFKRGFGFHPMFCFADATGEALAAMLRPGNATSNNAQDHLSVLDAAIGQLPGQVSVGHHPGDHRPAVARSLIVRADSAGCTRAFVSGCRDRNVGFAVVARRNAQIHGAIASVPVDNERWQLAIRANGEPRSDAHVCEITDLVDLSDWPPGTRLIVRREPRHPGAQTSLFPSEEFRYWGHYTDQPAAPSELDRFMRAHAHVEDHIRRLKDSGLCRFPFANLDANRAWLDLVCMAADLVRWFQLLCCNGELGVAEPKRLRWTLWHTPARVVRKAGRDIIRILDGWPTTDQLLDAYGHIAALT
jgi:Transposase DDE domain group 1